ncbi:hypothetical protein MASR2M78_20840 [Treponema sp.]
MTIVNSTIYAGAMLSSDLGMPVTSNNALRFTLGNANASLYNSIFLADTVGAYEY